MEPEPEIECVECGGRCFLLSHRPPEGWAPGEIVAYRCSECVERFDVVLPGEAPGEDEVSPGV